MKKFVLFGVAICFLFASCATKQLAEGEELVEYKDLNYKSENKKKLTKEEVREDCDMLKYIFYTCYCGIDEAIELGFDLDAAIEDIYNETMKKKIIATDYYSAEDFVNIIRQKMAKELKVEDQHLGVGGSLKDSTCVYYSKVYFEKLEDGSFVVKKSDEEKVDIQTGRKYTGPDANLFEMLMDGEIIYRYGVLTKKRVKTVNLSVDNEIFSVPVKVEDPIYQKTAWYGLKTTNETLYMSLSDCMNLNGIDDDNIRAEEIFIKQLEKISEAAKGKKNIVYDLRSNTGGRWEFPARMLSAAYYFDHSEEDFRKNVEALMMNSVAIDCERLISPFELQIWQDIYKKHWTKQYDRLTDERKAQFEQYWRKMKYRPIRKFESAVDYKCEFNEFPEPDFKGTVYILINRRTVSAAELGIAISYLLKDQGIDVKLIGENSCGGVKYVECMNFSLPNSGIWLYLPARIGLSPIFGEIPGFMGEGKGFYPDYWATSDNILETLVDCTGDKELETVLATLGKEML